MALPESATFKAEDGIHIDAASQLCTDVFAFNGAVTKRPSLAKTSVPLAKPTSRPSNDEDTKSPLHTLAPATKTPTRNPTPATTKCM